MSEPKFKNDQIVVLDPVGDRDMPTGKVIAVLHNRDGSFNYVVSRFDAYQQCVVRHTVDECEIHAVSE